MLLLNGIGNIFIFSSKLLIDMFLDKTLRLEVDGSKETVIDFSFFKALYIEYNPILAPISQKIIFSFKLER